MKITGYLKEFVVETDSRNPLSTSFYAGHLVKLLLEGSDITAGSMSEQVLGAQVEVNIIASPDFTSNPTPLAVRFKPISLDPVALRLALTQLDEERFRIMQELVKAEETDLGVK